MCVVRAIGARCTPLALQAQLAGTRTYGAVAGVVHGIEGALTL